MAQAAGNTHSGYRLTRAASSNPLGGLHEFLYAPTGLVFYPVADGQRGKHDAQMRLDRLALNGRSTGPVGRAWTPAAIEFVEPENYGKLACGL
jgi:hypothetical protein